MDLIKHPTAHVAYPLPMMLLQPLGSQPLSGQGIFMFGGSGLESLGKIWGKMLT